MMRKAAFAPLAIALMLSVGHAHADASDDAFLAAMQERGLAQYFSSPSDQISEAHRVCDGLRSGGNPDSMAFLIGRNRHMNDKGVEDLFINTAIDFYCPDVPHPQF